MIYFILSENSFFVNPLFQLIHFVKFLFQKYEGDLSFKTILNLFILF